MIVHHISDLHIRSDARNNKQVAKNLRELEKRFYDGDVLLITGDLTDDGKAEQFKQAKKLLAPFRCNTVLVPGNHDYSVLGLCYEKSAEKRFWAFHKWLEFDPVPSQDQVMIQCIDSCTRTGSVLDFAQGTYKSTKCLVSTEKATIVALHHDAFDEDWTMRLNGAKQLLNDTMTKVDAVCYGHSHRKAFRTLPRALNGPQRVTEYRCAPAFFQIKTLGESDEIRLAPLVYLRTY